MRSKSDLSIDPTFPEHAFFGMLPMKIGETLFVHPLGTLFTNLNEATEVLETIITDILEENDVEVGEEVQLIGLQLKRKIELKKEYWENPSIPYTSASKIKTFERLILFPTAYDMVVTPSYFKKKTKSFLFAPALPIFKDATVIIDPFMLHSDFIVSPIAKSAAIYSIESAIPYNWRTNTFNGTNKVS